MKRKKAIVLLSGGLDSSVALYAARKAGYDCRCLIFDYGQRHRREIASAVKVARAAGCPYRLVKITLPWKGSSLLDARRGVRNSLNPHTRAPADSIPSTYVPARNIIFLSFALSYAEAEGARAVFIGAHAQDYSGYPDCRPEFFRAFKAMAEKGTRAGVQGKAVAIQAPLLRMSKAEIIRQGARLGVPFGLTWSCYRGGRKPCGSCDSCRFRTKGFEQAGVGEP